jgi:LAGLIDADG DNA endonuclease family
MGCTSFRFKQSGRHKDYLFFLYDFFFTRGYCTESGPRLYKTILIKSANVKKIYYGYEFDLFTFSSLNWMYDLFYLKGKKRISQEISQYLTPLALAFLIMDEGGWVSGSKSVRIATNNFTLQEVDLLRDIFKTKFDLDCTIQLLSKGGGNRPKDKYSMYFKVASLPKLRELVLPFMIPSMKYKLGL